MNKCPKCGAEFEGKFCPNCGTEWQAEKSCPKCGTKLAGAARFCNNCGYAMFENGPAERSFYSMRFSISLQTRRKLSLAVKLLPRILFLLFLCLSFIFLALTSIEVTPNIFTPMKNFGNAYDALSLDDVPLLQTFFQSYFRCLPFEGLIALAVLIEIPKSVKLWKNGPKKESKELSTSKSSQKTAGTSEPMADVGVASFIYLATIGAFAYLIFKIKEIG